MKRFFRKVFNWELWPFDLIYAPLGIVWIWFAIRARAFWFFSPANPTLLFGGFEVGRKKDMYDQLPAWSYPPTIYIKGGNEFKSVTSAFHSAGLNYPVAAKPEVGMQGVLFRIIENEGQLKNYHQRVNVDYLVQAFIDLPMEFSVFYIRYPGQLKGMVTGFILKDYLQVTGDGEKTLETLIREHKKGMHRLPEMKQKHGTGWNRVIPRDEKYILSKAGNHNRGARFINLQKEIDQKLCDVFDRISLESGQFYFGRFDLKCTSVEDLKEGKNLFLLEFNGAGAEPNHIYDCGMPYGKALKEITRHWYHMYRIGMINHQKGTPYCGYWQGRRLLRNNKKHFKTLQQIDLSFN